MKHIRHLALCLLLALSLMTSAFAAEVPEELVVENLNGQQRLVKTYVLSPEVDPDTLKEPPFDYDGFTYTWAYTTKEEQPYLNTKAVTETVTVETSSDDLTDVLAALAPSIPYDDGEYVGELALDHTTLTTVAAGYTTKYGTVSETKVISNLDRNDMSYVPATTVKDGRTLSLAGVEWQVTGTDLVGETLSPSSWQAVATYTASTSWQAATGYGSFSTTQTGIMEKALLPGLQATVATSSGTGGYGISGSGGNTVTLPGIENSGSLIPGGVELPAIPQYTELTDDFLLSNGAIGKVSIPAIGVKNYYLWEGETTSSMNKGLGHFTSTSVWDGNVGLCGHNRGAKYVIGAIKDLEIGDTVTYTTSAGTRTYEVETVRKIASNDWSYLEPTSDNRITMITCVAGDYSVRWMVQAVEVK